MVGWLQQRNNLVLFLRVCQELNIQLNFMNSLHQPDEIIQDRYRVVSILGQGNSGITFQVEDLATKQHIALKTLSLNRLKDWKQVELFEREAAVLAKLRHPCIPEYLDYFQIDTPGNRAFYIAQAIAPGKSLAAWVESGWRTSEREVKHIAEEVLSILKYLHSLKPPVIHRDIKPNNIIRDRRGKIYLVDFGAVQNTYHNTLMQGSTVVGTYGYMAPEQFRSKAVAATDLYSLGATLLYLLTHRSPAELPQDTLKLDFRTSVNISEEFGDWLDKILEPSLEYRYTTALEAFAVLKGKQKIIEESKETKSRSLLSKCLWTLFWLGLSVGSIFHWKVLSFFGYHPVNVCHNRQIAHYYLLAGGKMDLQVPRNFGEQNRESKLMLECAISNINRETLRLLATKKIPPDLQNIYAQILLFDAVERQDTKKINLLVERVIENDDKISTNHSTALHNSVIQKNLNLTKLLADRGANFSKTTKYRNSTPLHYAIQADNTAMAELLLKSGADANYEPDSSSIKPLHYAIQISNLAMVEVLLKNGADVNKKSTKLHSYRYVDKKNYRTALSLAVERGHPEIVQLLIEYGANVNIDASLSNAIGSQIVKDNTRIIALLLKNGVDIQSINQSNTQKYFYTNGKYYNSVLSLAKITSSPEMVQLLEMQGVE